MNIDVSLSHRVFCKLQYWYQQYIKSPNTSLIEHIKDPQIASDIIYEKLSLSEPCMIARYGATELYCLSNYLGIQKGRGIQSFRDFIFKNAEPWWWVPERLHNMQNWSGFFPLDNTLIDKYCKLLLSDTDYLDILACWLPKEKLLAAQLSEVKRIFLPHLEPYYADNPWSRILEGKKMLVVHPFANQIKKQYYQSREKIFKNSMVLPCFGDY